MHPSLATTAFRLLPHSLRQSASAARDGSLDDLIKVTQVAKVKPASACRLFLPVFHAHLDPAKAVDVETLSDEELLLKALLALRGLSLTADIPKGAYPDMWPGLWKWSLLLLRHYDCVAQYEDYLNEVHITILELIVRIYRHCSTMARTMTAEPGFRAVVTQIWVVFAGQNVWRPGVQTAAFDAIVHLLASSLDLRNTSRQHHAELVEGSGGSLEDFAALLTNFVTHLANEDMQKSIYFMNTAMILIHGTDNLYGNEFLKILFGGGIVHALVTMLRQLYSRSLHSDQALQFGLNILLMLITTADPAYVRQALDAGLFQVLTYVLENPRVVPVTKIHDFIVDILGSSLPFRSFLIPLRTALASAHINLAPDSPNWDTWSFFRSANDHLMDLLRAHDSPDRVSMRGCDNVQCGRISKKTDFKSCSGCETVYYCSQQCQRLDWKRGHCKTCAAIRTHSIKNPTRVSRRDRSFFRTIVHDRYSRTTTSVLLCKLAVMHRKLDTEHVTTFEYMSGKSVLHTAPANQTPFGREVFGPEWDDQLSRVAASGGKMHLHVFVASGGLGKWVGRILPLRMHNPALRVGLDLLAREVPPGLEDSRDFYNIPGFLHRVQALVALTCGKGEIH